jgi:hypothetical protein
MGYGDRFIPKDRTYSYNKARASPTVIPFLFDIFGKDLEKIVGNQARILTDVLKMINAEFELTTQGLILKPKTKSLPLSEEVKAWGGITWSTTTPTAYTRKKPDMIMIKGELVPIYHVIQQTIFIPEWVREQNTWIDINGKKTENPFYRAIVEKNAWITKGFFYFLNRAILSEFDNSLVGLTAVAINIPDKRIIHMNPEDRKHINLNKYNEAVLYREPIVSKENFQVVKVETSEKIPTGKIGVSVEIQKAMYGDFDSDTDMLLGTEGIDKLNDDLYAPLEPITLRHPKRLPKVIQNRTGKDFLRLAFHEHMKRRKDGWDITNTGWLSKLALCSIQSHYEEVSIKRNLKLLEKMKDRPEDIKASLSKIEEIADRKAIIDKDGNRVYLNVILFAKLVSSNKEDIRKGRRLDRCYTKPTCKGDKVLASSQSPFTKWIVLLQKIGGNQR